MRKLIVSFAAMLLIAACAPEGKPLFIQISDPQLGFITKNGDFSPEAELMARMVEKVNAIKPDFVVFTGDLVHWRTDTAALAAFDSLCRGFAPGIKVYYLPGNHDVGNDALQEDVDAFVGRYGSDRFVHDAAGYTVVGFNSSVVKAVTRSEGAEYDWLKEQLQKADPKKPLIVAAHFPVYINAPDEPETYENLPVPMREKYMALFEEYGVDTYLVGHQHLCIRNRHNGIDYIIASALGRQLGKDKSGYTVVTFENGKPVAEYIGLMEQAATE